MKKTDWIIGIDLGAGEAQISIDGDQQDRQVPERVPAVLCPDTDSHPWLAGSEAMAASLDSGEALLEGFLAAEGPQTYGASDGRTWERTQLLKIYLKALLDLAGVPDDAYDRVFLTVTADQMNDRLVAELGGALKALLHDDHAFRLISHTMASEYYTIGQKEEFRTRDVGLFEYDHQGLIYHHLTVGKGNNAYIAAQTIDLTDLMDGSELAAGDDALLDERFSEAVSRILSGRQISTFYLVGEGFEETEEGRVWLNRSLQLLCAYRRHVFVGQNLYAKGAALCSHYMAHPDEKPAVMLFDTDIAPREIYLMTLKGRKAEKTLLLPAGNAWYNAFGECHVIIGNLEHLVFRIRDVMTGAEERIPLVLEGLPERPPKTTQLKISARFEGRDRCILEAVDEGFGTFFGATGKSWCIPVNIQAPENADPQAREEGFVVDAGKTDLRPLVMPVTGVPVASVYELCWYLMANVDILSEKTYDERFFDWLSAAAGPELSEHVRRGRSCREMTRRLLSSVDYFGSNEISAILDRLMRLEDLPGYEREKMAADTCMRNGSYMAALRAYHHLICFFSKDTLETVEITRAFKAAVWHNMGLASLKLHNKVQAADCMKRAGDIGADPSDVIDYLKILALFGWRRQFDEEAARAGIPAQEQEALLQETALAGEAFEDSERCRRVREGIALKHERRLADYSEYVQTFLGNFKNRLRG